MHIPPCPRTLKLRIGEHSSSLWVDALGAGAPDVLLNIGWGNVQPGPFRTSPPRPAELEIAIERIEDQVMPLARIIPRGPVLCVRCEGAGAPRLSPQALRLDDVEAAFSRLAAIAQGRPVGEDADLIVPRTAAAVLIVRELMHHTGLQHVAMA